MKNISDFIGNHDGFSILCVSETWCSQELLKSPEYLSAFEVISSTALKEKSVGRASGGLCIFYEKELNVIVHDKSPWCIFYLLTCHEQSLSIVTPNTELFECKLSNDKILNTRGRNILEFMSLNSFALLNGRTFEDRPAQFTHVSSSGNSEIDSAWVNNSFLSFVKEFQVKDDVIISDHFPMNISLNLNVSEDYRNTNKAPNIVPATCSVMN
ncbi:hypothetical protein JTB14_001694 [Gonioctena quinquepunctata]|nr:hypothetical protein JTB14_001694 [Gonioctena quinquepunctata]